MEKKKFPKPKKCKNCGSDFVPYDTIVPCCSAKCHAKWKQAKEKEKKAKAREKKAVSVSALTKKADSLWSERVKEAYGHKCAYCGTTEHLNSHHIFTRSRRSTRWDVENGICLCAGHHTLSSVFSAHMTSVEFFLWIEELKGREWIENLSKESQKIIKVTPDYLQSKIEDLTRRKTTAN